MFLALPSDLHAHITRARERLGAFADLRYAESIGSTNDAALALAASGAPEGTAVLADQQTAGRGRRGRSWSSPPGAGMYLSVVFRGATLTSMPGLVTLGAGVAAATAVRAATGLHAALKWPNDLVIGDSWKKLGGILCEAAGPDVLVVGTGINVTAAAHPPDVANRAASIEGELGRGVDRSSLVVECLAALAMLARQLSRPSPADPLLSAWREAAAPGWQGADVSWQEEGHDVRAIARNIDTDGALIVERDGRRERVVAGEVLWNRRP